MPKAPRRRKTVFEVDQVNTSASRDSSNRLWLWLATVLFVCAFGLVGIFLARGGWQQLTMRQPADISDTDLGSQPDESRPNDLDSHTVPPNDPRLITIDKIQVRSRIQKMELTPDNAISSPYNIHDVGWYERSARPGDKSGAMVVDGHLNGPTLPGVFIDLARLGSGDEIEIESGAGKMRRFRVVKTQNYEAHSVDMEAVMKSAVPGKLGLNLIVCSGQIDSATDQYNQRFVVFAVAE